MKNLSVFIFIVVACWGCDDNESGSGNVVTESRNTGTFTKINASQNINVEVRKGAATEVKVEADDNIIHDLVTTVEDGTLRIRMKENINVNNAHTKVYVTAPEITTISASSSADVEVKDVLTSKGTISFDASSSGEITSNVDAPSVEATASSAGEIKISGRTKNFDTNVSSGANIKAFSLLSENAVAEASSGGSAEVNASVSVSGDASSGGDINYRGAAANVKKQESSGGSVSKEN